MSCKRCGAPVVSIDLGLAGRTVRMRSCTTCDRRWYDEDDRELSLDEVLALVPRSTRGKVTKAAPVPVA